MNMGILKKLLILSCLIGFNSAAFASFSQSDFGTCTVFNEAEGEKGDDKKEGEDEEPDCE
jgi:hypothetical protein